MAPTSQNLRMIQAFKKITKLEWVVFAIIILIAAVLRLYNIAEYMNFLGDQGRDALIIKDMLVGGNIPAIGPPTSVGNIYLGPLYYYMMAVAMWLGGLDPAAASIMVAIIGTATVGLVYYFTRSLFGIYPALISSFLYAISPVTINYSRFSWNPNPEPFFVLLTFIAVYFLHKTRNFLWLILVGAALSASLQMHYLVLIVTPIIFLLVVIELLRKNTSPLKYFWFGLIGGISAFWLLLLPWLLFDFKHNFLNIRAITEMFLGRDSSVRFEVNQYFQHLTNIFSHDLIFRYIGGENWFVTFPILIAIFFVIAAYLYIIKFKKTQDSWPYICLSGWLIIGTLGIALYKNDIYDHYLGYLAPAVFIAFGTVPLLVSKFFSGRPKIGLLSLFLIVLLLVVQANIVKNPLRYPPNKQLQKTEEIAKFIISKSNNKPYNFALLAKNNYDAAYQFYLWRLGATPKVAPIEVTDQLFVVCEDLPCNPVGNAKYEVAAFGWTKIAQEYDVAHVKVYHLVPFSDTKP